jgi:hypothetical protein
MYLEKYLGKTDLFETKRCITTRQSRQWLAIRSWKLLPYMNLGRNIMFDRAGYSVFSGLVGRSLRGLS